VFTDELNRITGVPKDAITILFHDLTAEHVSKAGEMLVERQKK
jgi:phenylpyruvate tautomerase PptA (4-oxalocrotonate tautomerase family)